MLAILLLLPIQTMPVVDPILSPALEALVATRETLAPDEFARRANALAESGDMSAAELLGEAHMRGEPGFAADPIKACDWHARAAAVRGDAAHNIALCFETGRGRERDPLHARALYSRAIALGWLQSKCALGTMLVAGSGGPKDSARGIALCREAAGAGDANAQTDYGGYLLMGEAVQQDFAAAFRWLTAAASHNQPNAAFLVGQMHWRGDGTPRNHAEAARWWRVAHNYGRADAAGMLVREALERLFTVEDGKTRLNRDVLPESIEWLRIAAEHDPDPARRKTFSETLETLRPLQ